jgi:type I restriction enzyme S subunit
MPAVAERGRGIVAPLIRPFAEVRKGYTYFADGDVLFAKITPCMQNGKHAIAGGLIDGIGFGSTEFHVIRPGPEILPEWVLFYLVQPKVLRDATAHFSGAVGQQRVPEDYIASLEILLPPLDDQRLIVARIQKQFDQIEKARAAAAVQVKSAKALPAAYLREVFEGSEAENWPMRRLGSVSSLGPDNGVFKRRHEFGAGAPILNVSDLYRGFTVDLSLVERVQVSLSELRRYRVQPGDLFFCRSSLKREGIGRCCLALDVPEPAVFDCHVMRVRLDSSRVDPAFVAHYMSSPRIRQSIIENSRTATMTTMNQGDLADIEIPVPPLHRQRQIAAKLSVLFHGVAGAQQELAEQRTALDRLPSALLRVVMSQRTDSSI